MSDLEAERLARLQERMERARETLYLFGTNVRAVAVKVNGGPPCYGEFQLERCVDEVGFFSGATHIVSDLLSWRLAVEHDGPLADAYPGSRIEATFADNVQFTEFYNGHALAAELRQHADSGHPVVWVAEYLGQGELSKWKI